MKTLASFQIKTFLWLTIAALYLSSTAQSGTIVQCGGQDVCSSEFSIMVDNAEVGVGRFNYDAKTGDITLDKTPGSFDGMLTSNNQLMWNLGDGSFVRVDDVNGNADPVLGFSLAAGTGSTGKTFAFAFDLPIAIDGLIEAKSSVSYSLTGTTSAGAEISPTVGSNIVTALEVDTSIGGLGSLNKGVDVGETFFFVGGPQTQSSIPDSATNYFTGDLAYDLMSVNVAFALSADSNVGISGFVSQTPVPLPAAVWMLGSGVLALVGFRKRRATSLN